MKKLSLLAIMLLCGSLSLMAQTVLGKQVKPTDSTQYVNFSSPKASFPAISRYTFKDGFFIAGPKASLIGSNDAGRAIFNLGGSYSRLTFVLGPYKPNSASDGSYCILTITGDGKRLLDTPVWEHDALRYINLDVAGVKELKVSVLQGDFSVGFGEPRLWKSGQKPILPANPLDKLPKGKIKLVDQLKPHFIRHSGWVRNIGTEKIKDGPQFNEKSIRINRKEFFSGLQFTADEAIVGKNCAWSYFWLNKRYDKVSFIIGPRDNQSTNSSAWLIVKADNKIIYEKVITQTSLAEQVTLDVKNVENLSFSSERRSGDLMGTITFGVVDICAYPAGSTDVPESGVLNLNKDKLSQLPSPCPLLSNIPPYSVRGMSKADNTMFYGESQYITFSMGGEKFWEGLLLTTGNTLLSDMIDSYAEFDLGGEFDWISFTTGCLTKAHALDDDSLRIYADDKLVFDRTVHCTWPNQYYEIPVYKCRKLRFEKPGNGKKRQTVIGVADIVLYRGKPVKNDIFIHTPPDCPYQTDLIDLCGKPYFHYVGRFVSSLTNFSMDQCFHDGTTQREAFRLKDGSTKNKGFMLETNVPLGLEDVTPMSAVFMFFTGAGANLTHSDAAAYTGVTGGASPIFSPISLLLFDPSKKQASAAAFNPYGEYESCTFTVANIHEHVDEFAATFGEKNAPPVKLNVFADQRLVGEFWLDNKMQPTTYTVPIFKCHQLMFWLECGDVRSGQYLFYDIMVSKAPCNTPAPDSYTSGSNAKSGTSQNGRSNTSSVQNGSDNGKQTQAKSDSKQAKGDSGKSENADKNTKKKDKRVEWEKPSKTSGITDIDTYLRHVSNVWERTAQVKKRQEAVVAKHGSNAAQNAKYEVESINKECQTLLDNIAEFLPEIVNANLSLGQVKTLGDAAYFGKCINLGGKALNQCKADLQEVMEALK